MYANADRINSRTRVMNYGNETVRNCIKKSQKKRENAFEQAKQQTVRVILMHIQMESDNTYATACLRIKAVESKRKKTTELKKFNWKSEFVC